MAIRTVDDEWRGYPAQGSGHMRMCGTARLRAYDFHSSLGEGNGMNPKELLVAAYAGLLDGASADQCGRHCQPHPCNNEDGFRRARRRMT